MKVKNKNELLYKPFNFKNHADNFVNYCEVVIHPDGMIEYAIPSHSDMLIKIYCEKNHLTKDQVRELYFSNPDAYDIMMRDTGIVQVWYDRIQHATNLTDEQLYALGELLRYGCINVMLYNHLRVY